LAEQFFLRFEQLLKHHRVRVNDISLDMLLRGWLIEIALHNNESEH
jgi:hypothetical protein